MDPVILWSAVGVIVLILVFFALSGVRVVQQYERGVIFILGSLQGAKGPGLFWVPPIITRMIKVDLRIVTLTVPPQEVITRDNVTMKVAAVLYFKVVDSTAAVTQVMNFMQATTQIGQTTLRNVLGQSELTMQRAMAKQAEAEREKRAKVIHAEGELQASAQLAQAANVLGSQSSALQLRYLQTLTEIAVEKNSTIVFPLPIDIIEPFLDSVRRTKASAEQQNGDGLRAAPTPTYVPPMSLS